MRAQKVYFEVKGAGPTTNYGYCHTIDCYVKPLDNGYGHFFNPDMTLVKFRWCNKYKAKVIMSSELPKEMWYSISHGVSTLYQPVKEGEIGGCIDNQDIDIPSLLYEKVTRKEIRIFNAAKRAAETFNTLEEFIAFAPKTKGAKRLPANYVHKFVKLQKQANREQ